jgi:hypothetical protein
MSYNRVIPRDLFNEANLLKCYGQLWIKLDEALEDHAAELNQEDDGPFDIVQSADSGALSVANVTLHVSESPVDLFRPLNSRRSWALYASSGDDDVEVFDNEGSLSDEFVAMISAPVA